MENLINRTMNISDYSVVGTIIVYILIVITSYSCATSQDSYDSSSDPIIYGTIDYPFSSITTPLAKEANSDKLTVRAINGNTEYIIELPTAYDDDYNIQVPLSELQGSSSVYSTDVNINPNNVKPQITDQELIKTMPRIRAQDKIEESLVNRAFGVGHSDGPKQSPSYILGIAKINKLYLKREYEYALIEINNLLTYYPTSIKLLKMKGSILLKLGHEELAEAAWSQALELDPKDKAIDIALKNLRKKIELKRLNAASSSFTSDSSKPTQAIIPTTILDEAH